MTFETLLTNPPPAVQTGVYMAGILVGYLLLTTPTEWVRVRESIRRIWSDRLDSR
jgi:hypothetical protein